MHDGSGGRLVGKWKGNLGVVGCSGLKHWLVLSQAAASSIPAGREVIFPDEATSLVAVNRIPICSV